MASKFFSFFYVRFSLVMLLLNVLDVLTTVWFLSLGGVESNPFFSHLNSVGFVGVDLLVKFVMAWVVPSVCCWFIFRIAKEVSDVRFGVTVSCWLMFFYVFVVLNNLRVILGLSFDLLFYLYVLF